MNYLEIGLFTLSILPVIYVGTRMTRRMYPANSKAFRKSTIYGKIADVGRKRRGETFRLDGERKSHLFHPVYEPHLPEEQFFCRFAQKGDAVIKTANSNILILRKKGTNYIYTLAR